MISFADPGVILGNPVSPVMNSIFPALSVPIVSTGSGPITAPVSFPPSQSTFPLEQFATLKFVIVALVASRFVIVAVPVALMLVVEKSLTCKFVPVAVSNVN
jgi:hypothetical protein